MDIFAVKASLVAVFSSFHYQLCFENIAVLLFWNWLSQCNSWENVKVHVVRKCGIMNDATKTSLRAYESGQFFGCTFNENNSFSKKRVRNFYIFCPSSDITISSYDCKVFVIISESIAWFTKYPKLEKSRTHFSSCFLCFVDGT